VTDSISYPAVHNYNSIFVDANVVKNLIDSDPTGLSLNDLRIRGATLYITDTVDGELRSNLSGRNYATYSNWVYSNYGEGNILPYTTGVPVGRNQGEASIMKAINEGFAPSGGPFLVLSGDSEGGSGSKNFGSLDVLNSVGLANSLLLSGEINFARYAVLIAQIGVVAPHELVDNVGNDAVLLPGFSYEVNGSIIEVRPNGLRVNGEFVGYLEKFEIDPSTGRVTVSGPEECFLAGTMITMADGSKKAIEEIRPNDWVLSFDKLGILKASRVSRTMQSDAKIILDFHGTFVTPGHVFYCAGGKYEGSFAPLIDILRDDGIVQDEDGTKIRAATGCLVGSEDDNELWAFTIYEDGDGNERVRDRRRLRLGTRWMLPSGSHFSMREYLTFMGAELLENGYVRFKRTGMTMPFAWVLSDTIPNPEDFVLARSQTSLEDIYRAGQWESVGPQMSPPLVLDGGPVQPLPDYQLDMMPRNTPIALVEGSRANLTVLNRKERRAQQSFHRKTLAHRRNRLH
jgi:hypothetical protein